MTQPDNGNASMAGQPPQGGVGPLTVLWRRKILVLAGLVVGLVAGLLFSAQQMPVYQTNAQVIVIKKRADPLPGNGGDPHLSYVEDYVSNHLVIISSSVIVEQAIQKRQLQALRSFANHEDPRAVILGSLVASRDARDANAGPDNIINLSYRGSVADDGPLIVEAVIESYQDFLNQAYHTVSAENLQLLRLERDRLKKDYEELRKAHMALRDQNPCLVFKGPDGVNVYRKGINDLETELTKLRARQTKYRGELATIDKALKTMESRDKVLDLVVPMSPDTRTASSRQQAIRDRLVFLRLEEVRLRSGRSFGEGHPEVKAIRRQIEMSEQLLNETESPPRPGNLLAAELNEQVQPDALTRYVRLRQFALDQLETEEKDLLQQLAGLEAEAIKMDAFERHEAEMRDKESSTLKELEETTRRLHEVERMREAGGFDAQILNRPTCGARISSNQVQLLFGCGVLGFLLAWVLAYLGDTSDKRFRSPEEIRRALGCPVVGHIPLLTPDRKAVARLAGGQVLPDPLLCCYHRPGSFDAEAYRTVRTALYFSGDGEGPKVIQVTSPNHGDGKSLLVTNLAVAIARSGRKVVIVDADCRRPRQHTLLGLQPLRGLANVLAGEIPLDTVLLRTGIEGLSLLPCGPVPPNPAELLTSPRFPELLAELRERYDFVLLDTPPLLAVTDPCVVAARVDGVLLTLRLSRKTMPNARRARALLAPLGARMLGVVVNALTWKTSSGYQAQDFGDSAADWNGMPAPASDSTSRSAGSRIV